MLRSNSKWLLPVTIYLATFGSIRPAVSAQINYTFSANYNSSSTSSFITDDIVRSFPSWESIDASYGLNKITGLIYGQANLANLTNAQLTFDSDPTAFGLEGFPLGYIVLQGTGDDKLFAVNKSSATVNFQTLKADAFGSFDITGGEGRFKGALGKLTWTEVLNVAPITGGVSRGTAVVTGSFRIVPEPSNELTMLLGGMGFLGYRVWVRRRHLKSVLHTLPNCHSKQDNLVDR